MNGRPRGQEIKGQGRMLPKLHLEAWWTGLENIMIVLKISKYLKYKKISQYF